MKRADEVEQHAAVDLLDESMRLLRGLPGGVWAVYLAGTVPFVMAFLWFWADMARSAFAPDRVLGASALLALLYAFMKTMQARFCQHLVARLAGGTADGLDAAAWWRTAVTQTAIQSIALPGALLASVVVFPTGWVIAWGQTATVLGDGRRGLRETCHGAWRGMLWRQGQNHAALGVLAPVMLVVFVNVLLAGFTLPQVLKLITGEDTMFTRNPWLVFNSTVLVSAMAVTWVLVDPVLKAFYALRVFHEQSLATGADLLVDWRQAVARGVRLALLAACLVCSAGAVPAADAGRETRPAVPAEVMDQRIREVISQREYAWRLPQMQKPAEVSSGWKRWLAGVQRWLTGVRQVVEGWIEKLARWLDSLGGGPPSRRSSQSGLGWDSTALLWGGLGLVVVLGLWLLWRWRRIPAVSAVAAALPRSVPDVADEATTADELPEAEWFALAARLRGEGEWRLAVRALFLGLLAGMARAGRIRLHPAKSNRDYLREVERGGPGADPVREPVADILRAYESAWYGSRRVDAAELERVERQVQEVLSHAA